MRITMIIPAAGSSTRHPPNKLLNMIGDKTVIEQTLKTYLNFDFEILLITGYESEKIAENISLALQAKIQIIINDQYGKGLSESIKAGVRAAQDGCDYFGFSLGDKPFLKKETIETLLFELETNKPKILIPTFKGIVGHPTFFSQTYHSELLTISGDSGGRELLKTHAKDVTYFPVNDRGIILDMDTYYTNQNEN